MVDKKTEEYFEANILTNKEDLEEFQPIIDPYVKAMVEDDLNRWNGNVTKTFDSEGNQFVIYNGKQDNVNDIMNLVEFTQGINNCYSDTKSLLFLGTFFSVNSKFYRDKVISNSITYNIIDNKGIKNLERRYTTTNNIV